MINKKILNIELVVFTLISLCCLVFAVFSLDSSDHVFSISSNSEISVVSYYLVSFFAGIYYYVGPWIVFSLLFFALVYFKVLSQRDNWYDLLFVFTLSLGVCGLFYFAVPALLGGSLNILLTGKYASYIAASFIFVSIVSSFSIILEKGPLSVIVGFYKVLKLLALTGYTKVVSFVDLVKKQINKKKEARTIKQKATEARNEDIYVAESVTPTKVGRVVEKAVVEPVIIHDESKVDSIEKTIESVEQKAVPVAPVQRKSKPTPSFTTTDLIKTLEPENGTKNYEHPDQVYFNSIIQKLENSLREFKINSKVIDVLKGPVVDTFEVELGAGVRVSKVTTIQDDLTLALSGAPIRVVYPLKGKTTIGIEVPRNPREVILLDEVLTTDLFSATKAALPICMGKDAFGDIFIVDLAKMPHMLVAGATGAGKSVFINTLLVSLLVKKSHKELKLILIDPKQLELAQYSKLPHLALPVVTEPTVAAASLLWAVEEMERRYTLLKEIGVRNLDGFNTKVKTASPEQLGMIHHLYKDGVEGGYELPFIVIVIDEFADLILTKAGKDIETCVCRLAAKARAAGIHIVLATQRPSVDVITGLIKNNFPTRISFRVTSSMDSKTILTKVGAEKLLGMGDMLYKHGVEMNRVHSAYVGEDEVDVLCAKLESIPQDYSQAAMDFLEEQQNAAQAETLEAEVGGGGFGKDALFEQAVDIVRQARGASASMLQRRLRVGYNRAANLIDQMEMEGIIGPSNGSKPREIRAHSDD